MAEAAERKPVLWEPKLPLLPSVTKNGSVKSQPLPESVAVYRPTTELVDGMFLPPNNAKKLNKLMTKQVKDTAGKNWFDMPAPTITPELKKDMQLLKLSFISQEES
ncbi:rRNA-processing protein fcf2-like isoform X2 [Rhododendron vialii]|uniref:rRNA-processing protein fcf2-like isoform X2 n=1 Tax=Rhododendron vialii TaxID=182163 RepID=UPI00265D7375|nr:rRNA-processing protein fcf2-like isoform X2 [Rhododendron vialii]